MTWCSENSTSPGFLLARSAIHCRFVDRFARSMSSPVFPANGSLLMTPPFPPSGPGEPGSPLRSYEGATTSQPRINGRLFGSLPPPTVYPLGSCLAAALPEDRRSLPGQGSWSAGAPILRLLITWTRLGSLRSPGDPSRAFASFLDPGRIGVSSSKRPRRCCPRYPDHEGFDIDLFRG